MFKEKKWHLELLMPIKKRDKVDIPEASPEVSQDKDTKTREKFPIVGIGASAGGLAAFETFFSSMPADIDPCMPSF
jgi:two-component system CheB/CheR fusion protein